LAPTSRPKTGAIIGGVIVAVAAVLIVIGALVLLRRRRLRLRRRKSVQSSFSTHLVDRGPSVITPFDSVPLYPTHQGSDSWTERQQLLSESTDTEASPDPHTLSSAPAVLPRLRPVPPVPPGLSDKQLARIRTEALSSQQTDSHQSPNSNQSPDPSSNPSSSQSSGSRSVVTEQSGVRSPTETRRLQSEVELLRREMQQLRTERFEAPPSYTEGDA
jgi:LPXTG-motif cell wall-anchored protein